MKKTRKFGLLSIALIVTTLCAVFLSGCSMHQKLTEQKTEIVPEGYGLRNYG
jgi:hypothetical protein